MEELQKLDDLKKSIDRIRDMEVLFEKVTTTLKQAPDAVHGNCHHEIQNKQRIQEYHEYQESIVRLQDYYSNGNWLHDYELDEKKLLPPELKRGVLSQDGLYDLLCQVTAEKESE